MTQKPDEQLAHPKKPDSIRRLVVVLGMACYFSMADVTRVAYFVSLQAGSDNRAFAAFGAYSAIAAISIVFLFAKRERLDIALKKNRWFVPALSLVASLGVALILFLLEGEGAALWMARLCASIIPIAWFIIVTFAWGRVFLQESARFGMAIPTLSFIGGIVLTFCSLLPSPIGNAVVLATPFATSALWYLATNGDSPDLAVTNQISDLKNAPIPTFVVCGIFLCAAAFAQNLTGYNANLAVTAPFVRSVAIPTSVTCAAFLALALLISSRCKGPDHMFIVAWATISIAFFGCLFAVTLGVFPQGQQQESIFAASLMCFKLLLWIFTANIARNSQVSSVTAFSVLYFPLNLLELTATATALPVMLQFGSSVLASNSEEILLVLAFALIVVTFVFFVRFAPTLNESSIDSAKSTSNYEALSRIADKRGLTARETEIVLLVSQGYSAKTIAEMLYVSPETIRTHIKRIYRKLEVHNKQDIIKLVSPYKNA